MTNIEVNMSDGFLIPMFCHSPDWLVKLAYELAGRATPVALDACPSEKNDMLKTVFTVCLSPHDKQLWTKSNRNSHFIILCFSCLGN